MRVIQIQLPNSVNLEEVQAIMDDIDRSIQAHLPIRALDDTRLLVGRLHTSL